MNIKARRFNERIKLAAGALNSLALAFVISGFVLPMVRPEGAEDFRLQAALWWIAGGLVIHFLSQALLGLLQSEE